MSTRCHLYKRCENPECSVTFQRRAEVHKFCSGKCRDRVAWLRRRDGVKSDGTPYKTKHYTPVNHIDKDQVCQTCNKVFHKRQLNKYCSTRCRVKRSKTQKDKRNKLNRTSCQLSFSARIRGLKQGAAKRDIPFNLTKLPICPLRCPVTGKEFYSEGRDTWASLDRIDNDRGYEDDNVWWISMRANMIKGHATLEELKKLVAALEDV